MSVLQIFFLVSLLASVGFAAVFGGRDERMAAVAVVVATFLTPVAQAHAFSAPEQGIVMVDAALMAVLVAITLRSRSFWPMWAAGFQLVVLAVHFAAANLPGMMPAVYAETLVIWSYLVLAALMAGTLIEARGRHARS